MAYRLFVDSATGISLEPEWGFMDNAEKIETAHRVRGGKRYAYLWSTFKKFEVPLMFVNSSDASIINSWWASNTELLFKSESNTIVSSVMIISKDQPMSKFIKPYDTLYQGTIKLETY